MRVSPENRRMIEDMLWNGIDVKVIAVRMRMSTSIIISIRREMGLMDKAEETKASLYQWMKSHWNWKIENPPKQKNIRKVQSSKERRKRPSADTVPA